MEASLLEQEAELETQLAMYRAQLEAVKNKVPEVVGDDAEEMKKLQVDLEELIGLTEENLMEVKKHKLLVMLHEQALSSSERGTQETVQGRTTQEEEEAVDDLVGTKCRAPLKESWGGESHHNAVILCREPLPLPVETTDPPPARDDPVVRVLFTQPLYPAMKPCNFFLEGTCKFSEEECKFSHGHVVQFSKLRPFLETDHSIAHVGGRCLARHEDGLWYQAIISSVAEEYVVHFPGLSLTTSVTQDYLLPLESSDESSSDGGESEGEREEVVVEWKPTAALGQWEAHTTGIGSKLLAKMGYVVGQGLGKECQGRVEPVEIVILPAGKSLDVCAKLREEKKVKLVDGLQKKKKRKNCKPSSAAAEGPADMFEFLNTQVFSRGTSQTEMTPLMKTGTASSRPAAAGNLNVKLFELQEEMKAVRKRKASLKASLARHQKRKEKQLVEQVKEKLLSVEAQLEQLHRQERNIEKDIAAKSDKKKLSIF